jgi:hypothetical protein
VLDQENPHLTNLVLVVATICVLVVAYALNGCATLSSIWGSVDGALVHCTTASGRIVDDVRFVLQRDGGADKLSSESLKQLDKLATDYGASLIVCIIEQLVQGWVMPTAEPTTDQLRASKRARDFLASHKTTPVLQ